MDELSRRMRASAPDLDVYPAGESPRLVVPRSFRAALLAGLATACLSAGFLLIQHTQDAGDVGELAGVAGLLGVNMQAWTPALLLFSLLNAGQATAGTLLTAHFVLRRIGATNLFAYSVGGAAAGVFWVLAAQYIGLGGDGYGLFAEAAMGACAGFFYRLLAGARPAT